MVVSPAANPVTTPVVMLMLATLGSELNQSHNPTDGTAASVVVEPIHTA